MESTYELDYALRRLRDAVEFAEVEQEPDFREIRKWINEVEKAAQADQVGIVLNTMSAMRQVNVPYMG